MNKYIKSLIIRTILSILLFFLFSFLLSNFDIYDKYSESLFSSNLDFYYIRSKSKNILGKISNKKDSYVSREKIVYKNIEKYNNSYKLTVDENLIIKAIKGGVIVFIGNKEELGSTLIIEGNDGVYYWYSNINTSPYNVYDYIDDNDIIGISLGDYIYLTFLKDNKYLSYEEFI